MTKQPAHIRIGTRASHLARWQTDYVATLLKRAYPQLETDIITISTKGDRVLDKPLPLVGGKGLFTAELEAALHSGDIDLAVHSLKDLPTQDPDGLVVGAIPERADPSDSLISRDGYTLATLPQGAVIGTSSRRRAAQLLHQRRDLQTADIRGNIDTRIRKAQASDGPYDAIVLAYAGLSRLNLHNVISETLSADVMLPAPGQGALAIQCRDDAAFVAWLQAIHHGPTSDAVQAERAFLAALGGGCSIPVAAYAQAQPDGRYHLRGRVSAVDGSQQIDVDTTFKSADARRAGHELAQAAIAQGADRILESVE